MIKNVVFMGTPDFAVGTLKELIASEKYHVQAVFSQPDKPRGRGKALQMTPVKEAAVQAGIPVYQPKRIREEESLRILRELQPDAIVVVAFGQMIPESILNLPPHGCINVHASLLPKYRGAAPIQWAVLNGEEESGVTTMRMDAGLDTGDMILKTVVRLDPQETGGSLFDRLSEAGAKLLIQTLDAINDGTAVYEKQPEESPTEYAAMLTKAQGRIDWTKSAREIECLIRGMNPWPSAYTGYRGKTLKLWRAAAEPDDEAAEKCTETAAFDLLEQENTEAEADHAEKNDTRPGCVVEVTKHTLKIQTGDGILSILELQPEGKKRMETDAFLRGYPVTAGDILQ
ncbi:MAG: methionyl-tRNA formyltransferase [Lachnospiraceae bacterium]|nr:methionyl-tRNA formyltransferase [Lachnospiraceae bacterium]